MALFDPHADLAEVSDGMTSATWHRPGTSRSKSLSVLSRAVSTKERTASQGRYTHSDVVIHIAAEALDEPPLIGDLIIDSDGRRWTILQTRLETNGHRWQCAARELAIAHRLDDTVTVLHGRPHREDDGAMTLRWRPWSTGVRARIQPMGWRWQRRRGRWVGVERSIATVVDVPMPVQPLRVESADGRLFDVLAVRQPERLDALMTLELQQAVD